MILGEAPTPLLLDFEYTKLLKLIQEKSQIICTYYFGKFENWQFENLWDVCVSHILGYLKFRNFENLEFQNVETSQFRNFENLKI